MRSRIVGIDVGTKRVGMAIADPLRLFAQPHGTYSPKEALAELEVLNARESVGTVVVGWPLQEDGSEGPATQRVQEFVNRIRKRLRAAAIEYVDEGYTSEEARDRLRGRPTSRGDVDTMAAGIILQEYLDSRS